MITSKYYSRIIKLSYILLFFIVCSVIYSQKASAAAITSPTQLPPQYQQLIADYDNGTYSGCYDSPPQEEMIITFLTTAQNPSQLTTLSAIPAGSTQQLQVNFGIFICKTISDQAGVSYPGTPLPNNGSNNHPALSSANWYISAVYQNPPHPSPTCTGGSVDASPRVVSLVQPDPNGENNRYWLGGAYTFSYTAPTGTGCNGQGSIVVDSQEMMIFYNGTPSQVNSCGHDGASYPSVFDITKCYVDKPNFQYNIISPPVVTPNCSTRKYDITNNDPVDTTYYAYSIDGGTTVIPSGIPPGNSGVSIDMSGQNQLTSHSLSLLIGYYDSAGNFISNQPTTIPNYPVCYTVSCGASTPISGIIGATKTINASVNFTSIAGAPPDPSNIGLSSVNSISITQSGLTIKTISPATIDGIGTSSAKFNLSGLTAGTFGTKWSFGPDQAITCSSPGNTALSAPYLSVTGGDVVAGSNINVASSCSTTIASGILSWNNDTLGSGTTMAAQALAAISGFASDQGSLNAYNYLSFANDTSTTTHPNIDGQFGDSPCTPTFATQTIFSSDPSPLTVSSALPVLSSYEATTLTPLPGGCSSTSSMPTCVGTVVLSGTGSSDLTGQKTIYVKGNIYITGDIKYDTTNSWSITSSTNTIPSLKVIATGDIVIDPQVKQLDGVYETTQDIYDCSTHASGPNIGKYQNTTTKNPCYTNSLTVNGSFIANRIFFQRTGGNAYTSGSQAAETFNYGPEDWLSSPDSSTGAFSSFQQLPPVF